MCVCSHHINQLGDLQSETYFNGVIGALDWSDPALVALEEVSEEGILHLRQWHKLALSWDMKERMWINNENRFCAFEVVQPLF